MADTSHPQGHPESSSDALADLLAAIEEREKRMHPQVSDQWIVELALCIGDHALMNGTSIAEDLEKIMGLPPESADWVAAQIYPRCEARMSGYPPHLSAWDGRSRPPQGFEDRS